MALLSDEPLAFASPCFQTMARETDSGEGREEVE